MNDPSDAAILASARRALADAAPAEPSPALLAAVRREAARRARALRLRRALLFAAAAAAAVVLAVVHTIPAGRTGAAAIDGGSPAVAGAPVGAADSAVRLLLLDAAETRAALASASADSSEEETADAATVETESDWSSLSFAEALLAWQEAPLADLAVF